jgi:bisphosphoglycerate-independent phosphoglycerate mutase (AlkP superfamily)
VSWASAVGTITETVFEENEKSWSGDHCVNPPDVPGIFFCNQKVTKQEPSIMDIGPTVLDVFGVPIPPFLDGENLLSVEHQKET